MKEEKPARCSRLLLAGFLISYSFLIPLQWAAKLPPHITWLKVVVGPILVFGGFYFIGPFTGLLKGKRKAIDPESRQVAKGIELRSPQSFAGWGFEG